MSGDVRTNVGADSPGAGPAAGYTRYRETVRPPSLWVGWIWFAAVIMFLVGVFNVIAGLVALFRDVYYLVDSADLLVFDLTGWAWIHLVTGAVMAAAGLALLTGAMWARVVAVVLAALNAVAHVAFMAAYPLWSIIVLVLDIVVIWAVTVHGDTAEVDDWE